MSIREEVAHALWRDDFPALQFNADGRQERVYLAKADSVLSAVRINLKSRLQFDEEGVIEMLDGGRGPLED